MSIQEKIEIHRALSMQDEKNYSTQTGFGSGYCPAFSDGNPHGLPCDCPQARAFLLGTGREQNLCYLGVCPVRTILLAYP